MKVLPLELGIAELRSSSKQIHAVEYCLFTVAASVAAIGTLSQFVDLAWLSTIGLNWHSPQEKPYSFWVPATWALCMLLAPFAFRSGIVGVGVYIFESLSIQGSDVAAKCLLTHGVLDWTFLIILSSFLAKQILETERFQLRKGEFSLWILILLCAWVGVSWLYAANLGDLQVALPYRRVILWLHCLGIYFLSCRALDSRQKRLSILCFVTFVLCWRLLMSRDSVWLEGHIASYYVMLLPWLWFAISKELEASARTIRWLFVCLVVGLVLSYVLEPSFLLSKVREIDFGLPAVELVLLVLLGFAWFTPSRILQSLTLPGSVLFFVFAILAIQNRGSIVALAASSLVPIIFMRGRVQLLFLSVSIGAVVVAFLFTDTNFLVERFSRALAQGDSGTERLVLWQAALKMSAENLWLGVGPGQFPHRVALYAPKQTGLDTHNSWLEMLAETGIPGMLLFSAFWFAMFAVALKPSSCSARLEARWFSRAQLGFVVAFIVAGLFGSRHNLPFAYFLAAMGHAIDDRNKE
jgi:O-antigen ligase